MARQRLAEIQDVRGSLAGIPIVVVGKNLNICVVAVVVVIKYICNNIIAVHIFGNAPNSWSF